ncbi:MAG TPA: hypothetical protein VFT83_05005 [Nitrososphaeraceae archaeon]|nr:hypothetical protein [Nitrososphaeraceae archaeon]
MSNVSAKIKFHGIEVKNIVIRFIEKSADPLTESVKVLDASSLDKTCETINVQVVSDYVTVTLYKKESSNNILRRELIPTHLIQRIWIDDISTD